MATQRTVKTGVEPSPAGAPRIKSLGVRGFKSLRDECRITLAPLTLLAGANSSGKSSLLQPLLLFKQTLDAEFDPGTLLLSGPNVRFSDPSQMLSTPSLGSARPSVKIFLEVERVSDQTVGAETELVAERYSVGVVETVWALGNGFFRLGADTESQVLDDVVRGSFGPLLSAMKKLESISARLGKDEPFAAGSVDQLLELMVGLDRRAVAYAGHWAPQGKGVHSWGPLLSSYFEAIRNVIHVPGLRGNPERSYPTVGTRNRYPGVFHDYTASLIYRWQQTQDPRLEQLGEQLAGLGLSWTVSAKPIDSAQVEIRVGRLPRPSHSGEHDLVSVADVGIGVSQVLPVLVSLLTAEPGTLVYIEQPELHLHPRAQVALAPVLVAAANRGVNVVVETHSSLLLLGIQTLVAEEAIAKDSVALHWFQRGEDGATKVTSTTLDPRGAYGDWPEDFGDVQAAADLRFLRAYERPRRSSRSRK